VLRINSGGPALTDAAGRSWSADQYATGGTARLGSGPVQSATPDVDVTERVGDVTYGLPVPAGSYVLRLHLTELQWTQPGQRLFDVLVEGKAALRSVDILSTHAPRQTRVVDLPVRTRDGRLDLRLLPVRDLATVSGIELFPADAVEPVLEPVAPAPAPAPAALHRRRPPPPPRCPSRRWGSPSARPSPGRPCPAPCG
jgi:hypothetical protein